MSGMIIQCTYPDLNDDDTGHSQFYFHSAQLSPAHEPAIAWMALDAKAMCDRNGGEFSFTLNGIPCQVFGSDQIFCKV
jgi:hypothetical protein